MNSILGPGWAERQKLESKLKASEAHVQELEAENERLTAENHARFHEVERLQHSTVQVSAIAADSNLGRR